MVGVWPLHPLHMYAQYCVLEYFMEMGANRGNEMQFDGTDK